MKKQCPNITSPEWQKLTNTVGEDYAWALYAQYSDIPLIADNASAEGVKLGLFNIEGDAILKTQDLSEKLNAKYLNLNFIASPVGKKFTHAIEEVPLQTIEEYQAVVDNALGRTNNTLYSESLVIEDEVGEEIRFEQDNVIVEESLKDIQGFLKSLETTNQALPFNEDLGALYSRYESSRPDIIQARRAVTTLLSENPITSINEDLATLVGKVFYSAVNERNLNSFVDNYGLRNEFVDDQNNLLNHSDLVTRFLNFTPTTQAQAINRRKLDIVNSISDRINSMLDTKDILESLDAHTDALIEISHTKLKRTEVATPTQDSSNVEALMPQVSELFDSNPELANAVYEALGFEVPTAKLEGRKVVEGSLVNFDVIEELASAERSDLPSSVLIKKLLNQGYLPKINETDIVLGGLEYGIWRPDLKKIEAKGENKSTLAKKIGHELLHSVTDNIIYSYQNLKGDIDFNNKYYKDFIKKGYIKPVNLTKSQVEALDNLVRIKNKVVAYIEQNKDKIQKQDRGFGAYDYFIKTNYTESETDLHEFISEVFTNPELINILKEIPTEGKKSNLFKDFIDAISKILGFTNTSILEDIIAYSEEAFFAQPQITPQQKQQAQQLYSQYLDTIFPDSKVKDIVYHGSYTKIDKFSKEFLGKNTQAPSAKKGFFFGSSFKNSLSYVEDRLKQNRKLPFDGVVYFDFNNIPRNIRDEFYSYFDEDNFSNDFNDTNDIVAGEELNNLPNEIKNLPIFTFGIKEEGRIIPYSSEFLNYEDANWRLNQLSNLQINFLDSGKSFKDFSKEYVTNVVLNIKNPLVSSDNNKDYREESYSDRIDKAIKLNNDSVIIKDTKDPLDTDVYVVFEPEQIYILGNKQDIEGFTDWVDNSTKPILNTDSAILSSEAFKKFNAENPFTTLEENLEYYKRCKL